jgi:hypothetical protein
MSFKKRDGAGGYKKALLLLTNRHPGSHPNREPSFNGDFARVSISL